MDLVTSEAGIFVGKRIGLLDGKNRNLFVIQLVSWLITPSKLGL